MRIGELARRTGTSVRMLRYYEQQGLLASVRTEGGQRTYGPDDLQRVELVRALFGAGLSSRTIAEVMPCVDTPTARSVEEAHAVMRRERDRITATMAALAAARRALDDLIACNEQHQAETDGRRRPA
jgi:DNA-binding transcriptional MerR regulator